METSKIPKDNIKDTENEQPIKLDRNAEIRRSIERSMIPVLPFELELAKNALINFIRKQNELGKLMQEAMRQSSETYHDNAPADVLREEAKLLAQMAEKNNRIINHAEVFDYETDPEAGVTLGSLVSVYYNEFDDHLKLLLTGVTQPMDNEMFGKLFSPEDEVQNITISGPMGRQILGRKSGEKFDLVLEDNSKTPITIESIVHIKL